MVSTERPRTSTPQRSQSRSEMAEPRIDIVLYRDPDASTDLWVFVDGQPFKEFHLIEFDPGAGHQRSDVEENRAAILAAGEIPLAVRELAEEQFEIFECSPYIEGE